MTPKDEIRRIESLAVRIKPPAGLRPATSLYPLAGQVWTTSFAMEGGEPYLMLILDGPVESSTDVYNVAPLHRRVEYAGPDDVIVPREVAGHRLVVCIGASLPISRSLLEDCRGSVPSHWQERLRGFSDWLNGVTEVRPDVLSGLPYLDNKDIRWMFKESLGRELMAFQAWPVMEDEIVVSGSLIQFPQFGVLEDLQLAADSSIKAHRPLYTEELTTPDGVVVRVSEAENPAFVALEVVRDPGNVLVDSLVRDAEGNELGRISEGAAYFRLPESRHFKICSAKYPDGISFTLKNNSGNDA